MNPLILKDTSFTTLNGINNLLFADKVLHMHTAT